MFKQYQMKKWATSCLQILLNKGFFEIAIKGYKYEKTVLLFSVLPNVWLARSLFGQIALLLAV